MIFLGSAASFASSSFSSALSFTFLIKSDELYVFAPSQSTIRTHSARRRIASGISEANLSPHFVKMISLYLPLDFASSIRVLRLTQTLPSWSIERNVRSTGFRAFTISRRNCSSWKLFIPRFSSACLSLFTMTQSSSAQASDFESSRHSMCPG